MIPFAVVMIPQYVMFTKLGWTNTLLPLIIPGCFGNVSIIFSFDRTWSEFRMIWWKQQNWMDVDISVRFFRFYAIDEGGSGNAADVVVYGNLEWLSCTYYFLEKWKELDIAGGYPFLQFLLCNSEWLCFDHGSIRNCNDSDNGIVLYFPENDHWVHCNQRYQISNKL